MNPTEFIHQHIVKVLVGEGYPADVAQRGANKGVDHYRKCSQASKKGAMFDDCLHYARLEARYQTPKHERKAKPARNPKTPQEKLL